MSENNDLESVQKKLEHLDNELNTFFQVIKEVKEMRESAETLYDKLRNYEYEIDSQKKELEKLMSSTNSLIMSIEEQTKGVIFDLENKTDILVSEVKSGISQIGKICEHSNIQLREHQKENLEKISKRYEEIYIFCENLKTMVDSHEQRMNNIKNGYDAASSVYEKLGLSLSEIKKTVYELQKKPYEIDNRIKKMEERLETLINEKLLKHKSVTMIILVMVIVSIILSVYTFFFR